MKNLKKDIILLGIILLPLVFTAILWNRFPDTIPTHFGWDGKPDAYSGEVTGLLMLPGLNLGLYFVLLVIPLIDPKKKNYIYFADKFRIIRIGIHAFLSLLTTFVIFYSLGYLSDFSLMLQLSICLLFLILGNYMGNIRQNYMVGIRTPWTLSSERVWTKTHRLGAKVWVAGSFVMLILLPLLPLSLRQASFIGYIITITLIPTIYSYIEYRKSSITES